MFLPYILNGSLATLKTADYLACHEPHTFDYFKTVESRLRERSGIKPNDSEWYRYGRSQALTRFNPKILFPTNAVSPKFNLIVDKALFLNGYAIHGLKEIPTSLEYLKAIEVILNSKLIELFMVNTSYQIRANYVSYQKKYIEKVTVPSLSPSQIQQLISLDAVSDKETINQLVFEIYGLDYRDYQAQMRYNSQE